MAFARPNNAPPDKPGEYTNNTSVYICPHFILIDSCFEPGHITGFDSSADCSFSPLPSQQVQGNKESQGQVTEKDASDVKSVMRNTRVSPSTNICRLLQRY